MRPVGYYTWANMVQRCTNPNNKSWKDYGGRGITICDEWRNSFQSFILHVGPRPTGHHTIERIDNARGYEPGNVRWATRREQNLNRRPFVHTKKKTHCPQGRAYEDGNVYLLPGGARRCLICKRVQGAETGRRSRKNASKPI